MAFRGDYFVLRSAAFEKRIKRCTCFDEFNAWQNSLGKQEREQAIKDYTRLIQLGRSFSIYVIISQQDAHKASLGLSRDSIDTVIALGKLSKETVSMLFSDEKEDIVRNNSRGGWLYEDRWAK